MVLGSGFKNVENLCMKVNIFYNSYRISELASCCGLTQTFQFETNCFTVKRTIAIIFN